MGCRGVNTQSWARRLRKRSSRSIGSHMPAGPGTTPPRCRQPCTPKYIRGLIGQPITLKSDTPRLVTEPGALRSCLCSWRALPRPYRRPTRSAQSVRRPRLQGLGGGLRLGADHSEGQVHVGPQHRDEPSYRRALRPVVTCTTAPPTCKTTGGSSGFKLVDHQVWRV